MQPINVAVIGIGGRGVGFCGYLKNIPERVRVTTLVDINLPKARLVNEHYGFGATVLADAAEAAARDDVEAVLIATPDNAHTEPARAALAHNKAVYLEKPLATTLEDCDRVIDAAQTSTAVCYVGFNLRHGPVHEKVHHLVHDGAVGKVTTIEANEWYYGGKTYFRRWNRLRQYGGGLWLTKCCHDFDILNWLAGADPVSVYAAGSLSHYRPLPSAGPRCRDCAIKSTCPDYVDIANIGADEVSRLWTRLFQTMDQDGPLAPDICLFNSDKDTFDNGIAVVNYANDIRATYTVNVLAARTTRQLRIVGTEGLIEADMEAGLITRYQRHSDQRQTWDLTKEIAGGHGGADDRILGHFFDICCNGGKPRSDLNDGRRAVELSLAARTADDQDALVTLPLWST